MVSATFDHQFDAAFNSINSFRYLLTDPLAVTILRQSVYGQSTIDKISEHCDVDHEVLVKTLDHLEACRMINRDSDGKVKPVKDTVTYVLTWVCMAALYRGQNGEVKYGDDASRAVIVQVAHDLEQGIPHPPPFETFQRFSDSAKTITLYQAIPLSFGSETLAKVKMGEKIPVALLNPAQQDYLRSMLETHKKPPKDFESIVLSIDPTHEKDDDHAHIVIEADNGSYGWHIDAFLANTARPGWY